MTHTIEAQEKTAIPKKRVQKIPDYLVYEVLDGKPIYYRGYKNVLSGKLKLEDIMGSSRIQSFFISLIVEHFIPLLKNKYKMFYSEMGVNLSLGDNLSIDIAIYDKQTLTQGWLFEDKYADKPPVIAIEVDSKAALLNSAEAQEYFSKKIQKYLDFGVEQVVWVFTKSRKVWVAKNDGTPWLIQNWQDTITILGHSFSIEQLIKDYGFDPSSLKINQ